MALGCPQYPLILKEPDEDQVLPSDDASWRQEVCSSTSVNYVFILKITASFLSILLNSAVSSIVQHGHFSPSSPLSLSHRPCRSAYF